MLRGNQVRSTLTGITNTSTHISPILQYRLRNGRHQYQRVTTDVVPRASRDCGDRSCGSQAHNQSPYEVRGSGCIQRERIVLLISTIQSITSYSRASAAYLKSHIPQLSQKKASSQNRISITPRLKSLQRLGIRRSARPSALV
jgi:hypothetical protein